MAGLQKEGESGSTMERIESLESLGEGPGG